MKETQPIKPIILFFVLTGARETDSSKKVNHGRVNWNSCLSNILFTYYMNGIRQQAKACLSPLPTKVMTDQTNIYTMYLIQVLENTCMLTM